MFLLAANEILMGSSFNEITISDFDYEVLKGNVSNYRTQKVYPPIDSENVNSIASPWFLRQQPLVRRHSQPLQNVRYLIQASTKLKYIFIIRHMELCVHRIL